LNSVNISETGMTMVICAATVTTSASFWIVASATSISEKRWIAASTIHACDDLTVTLDSSVVVANSFYNATASSNAGFLGWTATSASANDAGIPNYDGFSTSGGWSSLSSVDPTGGLRFYFDSNAVLTGLSFITEGLPGLPQGTVFAFVGATGEIQFKETLVTTSPLVVTNTIDFRRDRSPTCSGGSTGCPSLEMKPSSPCRRAWPGSRTTCSGRGPR
jgi:hypothetical protein